MILTIFRTGVLILSFKSWLRRIIFLSENMVRTLITNSLLGNTPAEIYWGTWRISAIGMIQMELLVNGI